MEEKKFVPYGVHDLWIDEEGFVAMECLFCKEIHVRMIQHLISSHSDNPVAARILAEYYKAIEECSSEET